MTDILDILEYYDVTKVVETVEERINIEIPEEYKECYDVIHNDPISSNQISKLTNKSISEVNTILTMLELEGFIKSLPGSYFCRVS